MDIKEDYVSVEIAKLLKEKGFDWDTYAYYEDENNPNISLRASKAINWNKTEFISKPTHQMAMKWLREVHNLLILIDVDDILIGHQWIVYYNDSHEITPYAEWVERTIEETIEAAIKYCLENLI